MGRAAFATQFLLLMLGVQAGLAIISRELLAVPSLEKTITPFWFWPCLTLSPFGPAISFPIAWGVFSLCARRLKDAKMSPAGAILSFVPIACYILPIVLIAVPSTPLHRPSAPGPLIRGTLARLMPREPSYLVVVAVLFNLALCYYALYWSFNLAGEYGWTAFLGIPFLAGLSSSLIVGFHEPQRKSLCSSTTSLVLFMDLFFLMAMQIEGFVCILMAFPLILPIAILGSCIGFHIQDRPQTKQAPRALLSVFLLPLALMAEVAHEEAPPLIEASTSVTIDAPPEAVWNNVVTFSELPPPDEVFFRAGLAYPIRARIEGSGVGAVRYCEFSTGAFVEPIEVWDEPRLLRFAVTENPPVMKELNPFGEVHPPHLEGYFASERGQFRLVPLPGGRTRLVGTTWYRHRIEPQAYWRIWSDATIHAIHTRVLRHIKTLSEDGLVE